MIFKNCKVCGIRHSNGSEYCDNECKQVYKANKNTIDKAINEGVIIF